MTTDSSYIQLYYMLPKGFYNDLQFHKKLYIFYCIYLYILLEYNCIYSKYNNTLPHQNSAVSNFFFRHYVCYETTFHHFNVHLPIDKIEYIFMFIFQRVSSLMSFQFIYFNLFFSIGQVVLLLLGYWLSYIFWVLN